MAEHLRNLFSTRDWLQKHMHMKINEIVVMYINKDETDPAYPKFHWPVVEPKYSTFTDISKKYCFMCRGKGRAAGRRYCCFCESCCLALDSVEGSMTSLLDIPGCRRRHLSTFAGSEQTITCTAAAGIANQKARSKALWAELKRVLKAGKHVAIQARELWSTTLLFTIAPSPSHGPLPLPGQPNWIQMDRMKERVSCWLDHQWRFWDDLKWEALSKWPSHAENSSKSSSVRN